MPVYSSVATAIDKSKLASDVVYLALLEIDILDAATRAVVESKRKPTPTFRRGRGLSRLRAVVG